MSTQKIELKDKYRDLHELFQKNPTIKLTMDGDTPGYYSINKNEQQLCKRRQCKRKRNNK